MPSLFHNSEPLLPSLAWKYNVPFTFVKERGAALLARLDVADQDGSRAGAVALPQLITAAPSVARKYNVRSRSSKNTGLPLLAPARMSWTRTVPALVPSLFHNSVPMLPSLAMKYNVVHVRQIRGLPLLAPDWMFVDQDGPRARAVALPQLSTAAPIIGHEIQRPVHCSSKNSATNVSARTDVADQDGPCERAVALPQLIAVAPIRGWKYNVPFTSVKELGLENRKRPDGCRGPRRSPHSCRPFSRVQCHFGRRRREERYTSHGNKAVGLELPFAP